MKVLNTILFLFFFLFFSFGQNQIWFTPNKGQWEKPIQFKSSLTSGEMILENNGFTYNFHNFSELYHSKHKKKDNKHHHTEKLKGQVIKTKFVHSNVEKIKSLDSSRHYKNFYLSKDSSKWRSKVRDVSKIKYHNLYPNIDLLLHTSKNNNLKYDFVLNPNANIKQIRVSYEGMNQLFLKNGNLVIKTEFGIITETKPYSYQIIDGKKKEVKITYSLENNEITFLSEKYDTTKTLIIDPELIFSSFSGSTSDNWGFTATPDASGNLYAGGIVFGTGYPFITGSYESSFSGGQIDVAISKFNTNGTGLLYSTYIGGEKNESPHSMVVNSNQELYVLGSTSSHNFPTTIQAYNNSFNTGGPTIVGGRILSYEGSDIFISKFSEDGTSLFSSTYLGGSDIDGLSTIEPLNVNYGDEFRGEIIVDQNSNVYIASTTRSSNFPMVNAFNSNLQGEEDGIIVKLSPNLQTILFSSYIGGSNLDAAYSVQLSNSGDIYVAGGTNSTNFPGTIGGLNPSYVGGISDGYILKINGETNQLEQSSYIGTSKYNQVYFVQLDLDDNVYVFGQTSGVFPVSSNVYNNPNSGQFIQKLNHDLTTLIWSTTIGSGSQGVEISPTAFLVSDCYDIFIAGWGGKSNQSGIAINSSTNGFSVTDDAYQSTTSGHNFYLAVLDKDAESLKYATFFGGTSSLNNHVDGGTSRFDKKGSIYHAVCASCGSSQNGFTTTPGVWSNINPSTNCNLAAFKFDLGIIESSFSLPDPYICLPNPIIFNNESQNGNSFLWDFGDGNTSTEVSPSYVYSDTGTYVITLITIDTMNCYSSDTTSIEVNVTKFYGSLTPPNKKKCPNEEVQLEAYGGTTYTWSPSEFLNNSSISNPIARVEETTQFSVIITDSCGADTLFVTVSIYDVPSPTLQEKTICKGETIEISTINNAQSYFWKPQDFFENNTLQNQTILPKFDTEYTVHAITNEGCDFYDTITIKVEKMPVPQLPDTLKICLGTSKQVIVSGGVSYIWIPNYEISNTNIPNPIISTKVDTFYVIGFENACGIVYDTLPIDVIEVKAEAWNDTTICPGEQAFLSASGGINYMWFPKTNVYQPLQKETFVTPVFPTTYGVEVTDENGCKDTAYVNVNLFPKPFVIASPNHYGVVGDLVEIGAEGNMGVNGSYTWKPNTSINCDSCQYTTVSPLKTQTYTVYYVDTNDCKASDYLTVYFNGILYVPNAFTPNEDPTNSIFKVIGKNIIQFKISIFNRWGELMYESNDINKGWNGTYKGQVVQDGVYVWKITFLDAEREKKELVGHVTLLR